MYETWWNKEENLQQVTILEQCSVLMLPNLHEPPPPPPPPPPPHHLAPKRCYNITTYTAINTLPSVSGPLASLLLTITAVKPNLVDAVHRSIEDRRMNPAAAMKGRVNTETA